MDSKIDPTLLIVALAFLAYCAYGRGSALGSRGPATIPRNEACISSATGLPMELNASGATVKSCQLAGSSKSQERI